MSQPKSKTKTTGPDGATIVGAMRLTGVVRTTRGYAVATLTAMPDGSQTVALGVSQTFREFVAKEHGRAASAATEATYLQKVGT